MVGFQIIDLDLLDPKSCQNRIVCVANFSLCPPQEPPGGGSVRGLGGAGGGTCGTFPWAPPGTKDYVSI